MVRIGSLVAAPARVPSPPRRPLGTPDDGGGGDRARLAKIEGVVLEQWWVP
jgi:hypothetical protein